MLAIGTSTVVRAQDFSDDFTRSTNSSSILPWINSSGAWVITNGVFRGGPNANNSYGTAYVTNNFTNCTVSGEFSAPTTAFGYGVAARVNPMTGARYATWLYPENSGVPASSNVLRLIKFQTWTAFGYNGTENVPMVEVKLESVGTNVHLISMIVETNIIRVYVDNVLRIITTDSESSYHTNGGIGVDMYTFQANSYVLTVDNVSASHVNYAPIATADSFTVRGDMPQTVGAPGVLYNDIDFNNDTLSAILVNTATNGTLSLNGNGGFTYTRTNAAASYDSFTYRASDGLTNSSLTTVQLTLTAGGYFLSDNFSRSTNPASLLPWTNHSGNWTITNGVISGGPNNLPSYATVFNGNDWADYAVEGSFLFPTNAYGGGIGGRVNPATGHRYAAWLYPELSDRGPNNIRIVKFQSWDTYGYNNVFNAAAIAQFPVNSAVITNTWHTLKLAFQTNLLSVYLDGQWLTNVADLDTYTNPYPKGGVSMDFFTFTNAYVVQADSVSARPLVADDNYVTTEGSPIVVSSGGVLTNDTGISSATLTAIVVANPAHGALSFSNNGTFIYTPEDDFVGLDSFTYETRQGANTLGAAIVNISIGSENDAPQLPNQPDYLVVAGDMLIITNTATDIDVPADTLSYTLVGVPNGVTITTNGIITWSPALAQSASTNVLTTIVTDNGVPSMSATNFITVVVLPPVGTYAVGAFFEDFDSVTAPSLPVTWTTAQSSGQVPWMTQTAQQSSLPNAAFSAEPETNGANELVTPAINLPAGEFQLQFRNQYDLESDANTVGLAYDGGVLEIKIGTGAFTDILAAGGSFLSGAYTHTIASGFGNPLAGRQAWSGNSEGFLITTVALPASVSGQTIQLRWRCGTDEATAGNGWAIDDVGITNLLCCNLFAPVLPMQPGASLHELTLLTVTNTASDGDLPADQLSYVLTASPAGASINPDGVITWMPSEAQGPMTGTFTTVVTDKGGLTATNSFEVVVEEVNVAPVFVSVPTNTTIAELTTLIVTNNATDADLPVNELTYTLLNAPGDATISSEGVITWTPSEAEGSTTNLITTVVSDGTLSVTNEFEVVVEEVNVAPVFASVPTNVVIDELTTLTVTNNATDADLPANTLTYLLLDAPGNATISSEGVIIWTPGEAEGPTTNVITTVVSDGTLSVTNEFEVVVKEVNVAPAFVSVPTNTTIAELTTLTVTNNATDADL
ncbi:MAG TPA: Ig-like domain-containing protein, partial [Verrucomicrobiae bacterium]|nr:Ig-like domain-containing protein [Verrucomicrobiae bacterium]